MGRVLVGACGVNQSIQSTTRTTIGAEELEPTNNVLSLDLGGRLGGYCRGCVVRLNHCVNVTLGDERVLEGVVSAGHMVRHNVRAGWEASVNLYTVERQKFRMVH